MSGEYFGLENLVNNNQNWPIDAVIGDNIEVVRETIKRRLEMAMLPTDLMESGNIVTGKIVYDNWLGCGVPFPTWAIGLVKDES